MQNVTKEKLDLIIEKINHTMVDPEIDLEYFIPESDQSSDIHNDPYIIVKHAEEKYTERKIRLNKAYMDKTPDDVANFVTFSIEQYKEEVESLNYGAQ